ncbi:hypothetical protein DYU11_21150 [Fibrisoma montanum]|uniref:Uncharacterized protein n=1 Tax=Fibrisoma montanum TaxID=2305895 RepID=A0A418M413_9BACT|nr:hypothetical protein [Fibrisoma montanum]RIV20555.1 hypothetical protein DYU11_21150 [Fibrisoma montanum]
MILNLFSSWELRNRKRNVNTWKWYNWLPEAGLLTQENMILGYNLDRSKKPNCRYDPDRLYCLASGSILYIQAINHPTEEALVYSPFLPDAHWIKDNWYLVDMFDLSPVTMYGFDEQAFRDKHPEKPCPYIVEWGLYVKAYNNMVSA